MNTKKRIITRKEEANIAIVPYLTGLPKEWNLTPEEIIIYSFLWDFLSSKKVLLALTDKQISEILNISISSIKKGIQKLSKLPVISITIEKNVRYIAWLIS